MAAVEKINPPLLKKILASERETFNVKFNHFKHIYPRIDKKELFVLLRRLLPPLVENLENYEESTITAIIITVYEKILELLGKGFFEKSPQITFDKLLCELPHLLAEDPELFIGSTANAIINIAETPGARVEEWQKIMLRVGKIFTKKPSLRPKASLLSLFLEAGKIAAWRCGLAHYRLGALQVCKSLPFELVKTALNFREDLALSTKNFFARLEADPWLHPALLTKKSSGRKILLSRKAGGFSGFGGPFIAPPLVTASASGFIVSDMEKHFLFFADIFGQVMQRISPDEFDRLTGPVPALVNPGKIPLYPRSHEKFTISPNGALRIKDNFFPQTSFSGYSSFAGNSHSFCLTLPLSHHFYFGGLAAEEV